LTDVGASLKCRYRTFGHNSGVNDFDPRYDDWRDLTSAGSKIERDFVEVFVFVRVPRPYFSRSIIFLFDMLYCLCVPD
jgi:hypothetical protein